MNLLMLKILDDVCVYISFIINIKKNESFSSFFFLLVKKNLLNPRIDFFFHHFSLDTNLKFFFRFNLSPIYEMNKWKWKRKKRKIFEILRRRKKKIQVSSYRSITFFSYLSFFWPRWKCFFPFQRFFSFYFRWWWWWWL